MTFWMPHGVEFPKAFCAPYSEEFAFIWLAYAESKPRFTQLDCATALIWSYAEGLTSGLAPLCPGYGLIGFISGGLQFGLANHAGRKMLSRQYSQDAIGDPRWQFIRPLAHRLIGDANGFGGSGSRTSEQFNGL